ncbi:unnamed protein product [Medioppia subpectinata]|uniref:Uncharacterized protein n=1 Tax=Medioppia subpectinata TaxID=1979941 RepID=A0A7R9QGX7_9ACAR|nr:unnamed protein product [Medioppia subpectinata]CAG2120449.1 unnamed protein product [Medioppia subpectinata]
MPYPAAPVLMAGLPKILYIKQQ